MIVAFVLAGGVLAAAAQVKGSRTVISTPYSRQIAPSAAEIGKMKTRAGKERTASISNSKIGQRFIAFSTCNGATVVGMPVYVLKGTDGSKAVSFDLAELESMRAETVETDRTLFTITRFPVTTAAALLKDTPSYSDLRARAAATSSAWVGTMTANGTACLVEQGGAGKWVVFSHLGKVASGTTITFDYAWMESPNPPIWWATPSVVADVTYPYKRDVPVKH